MNKEIKSDRQLFKDTRIKYSKSVKDYYLTDADDATEYPKGNGVSVSRLLEEDISNETFPILKFILTSKIFSASRINDGNRFRLVEDEFEEKYDVQAYEENKDGLFVEIANKKITKHFKVIVDGPACSIKHLRYLMAIYQQLQMQQEETLMMHIKDLMEVCGIRRSNTGPDRQNEFLKDLKRIRRISFEIIDLTSKNNDSIDLNLMGSRVIKDNYVTINFGYGLFEAFNTKLSGFLTQYIDFNKFDSISGNHAKALYLFYRSMVTANNNKTKKMTQNTHLNRFIERLDLGTIKETKDQRKAMVEAHDTLQQMGLIRYTRTDKSNKNGKVKNSTKNDLFSVTFHEPFFNKPKEVNNND